MTSVGLRRYEHIIRCWLMTLAKTSKDPATRRVWRTDQQSTACFYTQYQDMHIITTPQRKHVTQTRRVSVKSNAEPDDGEIKMQSGNKIHSETALQPFIDRRRLEYNPIPTE